MKCRKIRKSEAKKAKKIQPKFSAFGRVVARKAGVRTEVKQLNKWRNNGSSYRWNSSDRELSFSGRSGVLRWYG
jgi:hypothetical protein